MHHKHIKVVYLRTDLYVNLTWLGDHVVIKYPDGHEAKITLGALAGWLGLKASTIATDTPQPDLDAE
jgi:hypothetical protein